MSSQAEYADVEVFRTDKKGWGLKAIKDIPRYIGMSSAPTIKPHPLSFSDTFIMEYCGEVCTIEDFEQRKIDYSKENRRHYYFMSLRTDQVRCMLRILEYYIVQDIKWAGDK